MACPFLVVPPGDSCTFKILPVGGSSPQHVQIYCSQGTQEGKYIVVKPNMDVIAGSPSDGDTAFHRDNVAGSVQTMYLSYPAIDPTHYLAFESDSREAQLEVSLTSRAFLEVLNGFFRRANDGTEVLEGMSVIDDFLTVDPPATVEPEPSRKAEV